MHHGWFIVALVFGTQFIANTVGFYALGVVLTPIAEEFGASRAYVGMIPFALSWAGAVYAPLVGRAVTKIPIGRLMAAGSLAMGAGFLAMSQATAVWQLQLGYALGVAAGINVLAGVVASALVVNWFETRRALALGIAGVGISLAGFVMTPISSSWVAAYGWRGTFQIFAGVAFAMVPVVLAFATTHPRERGSQPFGAAELPVDDRGEGDGGEGQVAAATPPSAVISTREALRTPALWLISMTGGVCFAAATAVITHGVSLGTDAGYDIVDAAWVVSAVAGGAMVAKVLFGALAEPIGERGAFVLAIALQMVGLLGMAEGVGVYSLLIAMAALFGLGMGATVPLMNALYARVFGPESFGPVMGLGGPILILFQSMGAPFLGYVYDTKGTYEPGLWIFAGLLVVPLLAVIALRFPEPGDEAGDEPASRPAAA